MVRVGEQMVSWVMRGFFAAILVGGTFPAMAALVSDASGGAAGDSGTTQVLSTSAAASDVVATPSDTTTPPGTVVLEVNTSTGDVRLIGNAQTLSAYQVDSATSAMHVAGWNSLAAQSASNPRFTGFQTFGPGTDSEILEGTTSQTQFITFGTNEAIDITKAGDFLFRTAGAHDLVFSYGDQTGNFLPGSVVYVGAVPEPAAISILGLGGALALLGRRKRAA